MLQNPAPAAANTIHTTMPAAKEPAMAEYAKPIASPCPEPTAAPHLMNARSSAKRLRFLEDQRTNANKGTKSEVTNGTIIETFNRVDRSAMATPYKIATEPQKPTPKHKITSCQPYNLRLRLRRFLRLTSAYHPTSNMMNVRAHRMPNAARMQQTTTTMT